MKNKTKNICSIIILTVLMIVSFSMVACTKKTTTATTLSSPQNLRVEDKKLVWDKVENALGYSVKYNNKQYTVSTNSYSLSSITAYGSYELAVMAYGDGSTYLNSEWASYTYTIIQPVLEKGYDDNGYYYVLLKDGSGYEMFIKQSNITTRTLNIPSKFSGLPVKKISYNANKGEADGRDLGWFKSLCNQITSTITLPNTIETIGKSSLAFMLALQEITLPDSVTEIAEKAFESCIKLKSIAFSQNLKTIGKEAFYDTGLDTLVLPNSLESIGDSAFLADTWIDDSNNLSSVSIPASVKSIGDKAFYGRKNLEEIKFENIDNLEKIGNAVFDDTAFYNNHADGIVCIDDVLLYKYKGTMPEEYRLGVNAPIKAIAEKAFYQQENLKSVNIANGVKLIGTNIFDSCSSLAEVRLPADLIDIPAMTFQRATNLTAITIPETVTKIGNSAFYETGLTEIVIPKSVISIGSSAFHKSKLTKITFNEGLEEVGMFAFSETNITNVTLPKSLKSVLDDAFGNNVKLFSVVFSDVVETFKTYVFNSCPNLSTIFCGGDMTAWKTLFKNLESSKNYTYEKNFSSATIYYYIENRPTEDGNYWHYVNGVPTIWEN